MSDVMRPLPFGTLMNWILTEHRQKGAIFGVARPFQKVADGKLLSLFGEKLETPFGPAAGPHTQLSQNIVAAYYAGSRFFELKTVQTLDGRDLPVAKPCIDARDECYNCEWSTELRVSQALEEYVRAWYAIKLISREFRLGREDGFIFNMSVGYDLEGIKSPKIDNFIEGLKDASQTPVWQECRRWALENTDRFAHVDQAYVEGISPRICNSITLSTLHGCPPREIERIAAYLLEEKGLNTFVKCNPTMLGYDDVRQTLDELGFDCVEFDDHHFKGDLQYEDAVPMVKRLLDKARVRGLSFGLKLTNTCPVDNREGVLPGEEMYMSGRALYPLTVSLARKLSREFGGALRISYSGGADYFNIGALFAAGIWPITLATTLLKPGGYQRLTQIAERLAEYPYREFEGVDLAALDRIAAGLKDAPGSRKSVKPLPSRKLAEKVPLFDCFTNPCQKGCPIHQDIPSYVALAGEGRYLEALKVITEKNPLPFITGTICNHRCMEKCTRNFYEEPVRIRDTKLLAAEKAFEQLLTELREQEGKAEDVPEERYLGKAAEEAREKAAEGAGGRVPGEAAEEGESKAAEETREKAAEEAGEKVVKEVGGRIQGELPVKKGVEVRTLARAAVVGGGPAGMAAAYFLARQGVPVTVFEKARQLGGIVRQVIPEFRISDDAIDKDVALLTALGAEIRTGCQVKSAAELAAAGFTHVILAVGAWQPGHLELKEGKALNVLEFLQRFKADDPALSLGRHVVVTGGGNTAMDAARAAKRWPGVETASLVYRRTRRYMPADGEELRLAEEDGVEFLELLTPESLKDGILTCRKMVLGAPGADGRRRPEPTADILRVPCHSLISAVGERTDGHFYEVFGLKTDDQGRPLLAEDSLAAVFTDTGGECIAGKENGKTPVDGKTNESESLSGEQAGEPFASEQAGQTFTGSCCASVAAAEKAGEPFTGSYSTSVSAAEKADKTPEGERKFSGRIYVVGDGRKGPATVVEAIADSARAAKAILAELGLDRREPGPGYSQGPAVAAAKRGTLRTAAVAENEGQRCLDCGTFCESCVQVCPNRANVAVDVEGRAVQIVHIDGMCNECGNCAAFCPYDSAPYRDKLTLFGSQEDFENSENQGFLLTDKDRGDFLVRLGGRVFKWRLQEAELNAGAETEPGIGAADEEIKNLAGGFSPLMAALLSDYDYLFQ